MKEKILIADDEIGIRELLHELLKDNYEVETAEDGEEAILKIAQMQPDLILLDIRMPKKTGLDVLQYLKDNNIDTRAIIVTADRDLNSAIKAMKLGAYDYVVKPFENEKIITMIKNALKSHQLEKEVKLLKQEIEKQYNFNNIIGQSKAMQSVYELINKVLDNDTTVLITGESGTGKEVIAKAIHYNGKRKDYPFIAVDCASIPETLIESELFGHEKGAYTGATNRKKGKFEIANKGTLFLDEIGNLRLDVQAKLLRVLQEKEIYRVGGNERIKVNVRIIAATNADLEKLIKEGKFREDLYYRLNVVPIKLPPLRERKDDIPLLIQHFLNKYNKEYNKNVKFNNEVIKILYDYPWPGNVRELENLVQRMVVISTSPIITVNDLPQNIISTTNITSDIIKPGMSLDDVEKIFILETLKKFNFNLSKTAKILGITRKTLHNKIDKYPQLKEEIDKYRQRIKEL